MKDEFTNIDNVTKSRARSDKYAYSILTLTTFFFAANHVIGRGVHTEIPPIGLSFWRWSSAAIILLPFVWRDLLSSSDTIKMHIRPLSFLGCTMIGSTMLVLIALNFTSAINVALINATQPILTVLLAWLIFREHLLWTQLAGIFAALIGVVIMVSRADWHVISSMQFNGGDIIALLAMLGFAVYAINIRLIPAKLTAPVSLFVIICSGCLGLLPFYIVETLMYRSVPFNMTAVLAIITLALTASLLGMLFWNEGNRIIGPGRAGMFINLIPLFTATLAIVFLGEALYLYHLGGAVLISAGIFLVLRK